MFKHCNVVELRNDSININVIRYIFNSTESFFFKNSLISSVGRVILGPVIGFLLIKIFDLSGYAAGVLLIQSSMPSAILTYLIASMYSPKEIVDNISSMIVVSTLMSLITVPIIVFIALKYFS